MDASEKKCGSLWTCDPDEAESQLESVDPATFDVEALRKAQFDVEALRRRLAPYRGARKGTRWETS